MSLGCTRRSLMVVPSLKNISTPCFLQMFVALTHALDVWDNYVGLVDTTCLVCVFDCPLISACLLLLFDVSSVWAHSGYLHLFRAMLRWSSSVSRCWLEHTVLTLCFKVLITPNLADRWWWLFHCKYWSMCVGFLYTDVSRKPSGWGITIVSRKGMDPSVPACSVVKWMCGSTLLMCSRKPCFFVASMTTKVSSTYLFQIQAQNHFRKASKKIWMIVPTNKGWPLKHWWLLKASTTSCMYGTKNCFNIWCFNFTNNMNSISSSSNNNNCAV